MFEWNSETADWYAANYGEHPTISMGMASLKLRPSETLLDIGSGTGFALRLAASRVTQGRLIGIDPTPRMIEIAQAGTKDHPDSHRIRFQLGAAEKLPLRDREATVVLAFDSFDHWTDKTAGLAEVSRVLTDDGTFAVLKDHEGPGGPEAMELFRTQVKKAGFAVLSERELREGDIVCTLWTCELADR